MILCVGTTPAAQRVFFFSQLTPGEVNRARLTLDGPAGKSVNVAKVLHALGDSPCLVTFLGGTRGAELERALHARGIRLTSVPVDAPTRECVTVIDEATHTLTELVEESRAVAPEVFQQLLEIVRTQLPHARALVLSGSIAPGGPPDLYARCVHLAHAADCQSVVDASGPPLLQALQANPTLVKPNRSELAATIGRPLPDEAAVFQAMHELASTGTRRIVVTAGHLPTLALEGTRRWRIHSPRLAAVNPIGSGDAFTAGLISRLVRGDDLGEACRWASAAGAANALTPMAGEVQLQDVERLARDVDVLALPPR